MVEKINLLIVEDDPTQIFLIMESLEERFYNISTIHDGREALEFLLSTPELPDLILMDYHLPNLDGLMILDKLKENGKKFNIIFLTADYSIETAIKSINSGALEFIPKDGRFVNNIPAIINKAYQTIKANKEREEFESALKESESRFKMVMDASKDGIFEWNSLNKSAHVSSNNARMLGYEDYEFPGTHNDFFNIVHPDDRSLLMQKFQEHLLQNTSFYEAEIRVKAKNGKYKWLLERGIVAEKSANNIPVRVIGTHSDISERKEAEERIIEASRRLTTLISNLPGIVYRCNSFNIFQKEYIGGRVFEITGYTAEELLPIGNCAFENIVLNEDKLKAQLIVNEAIKNNTDYEIYYRVKAQNGEIRWFHDHGRAIIINEQSAPWLEGYVADITEKRVGEIALKQSEEEKNIILDNSLQAFVLLSTTGKIVAFNKVANHRIILMANKTLKKDTELVNYYPEGEKERMQAFFNKVINGEQAYWEQPFVHRNEISWYENVLVPIFASREEIKLVCFTSTDITERKLAEEQIRYSESLYNTTISSFNDIVYVVDQQLNFLLVNEAMIRFNKSYGYQTQTLHKSITEIYPFFNERLLHIYKELFISGSISATEENINLNGKNLILDFRITPVFQQKKVVRAVTVIRDITERKNFEKRIMNAIIETEERERKRFSEDLHDEMGSILSTIKIYLNTIHNEQLEVEKKNQLVEVTNQLIDQAIQNSKEIANNLSPNVIKRFGLLPALESFFEKIQISSGIQIFFETSNYSFKLKEDEEISVYRIITELTNNTIKHAKASVIEVKFSNTNGNLEISYSDNGKGFDFESALKKSVKGLGLQNIVSRIGSLNGIYKLNEVEKGFSIAIEFYI